MISGFAGIIRWDGKQASQHDVMLLSSSMTMPEDSLLDTHIRGPFAAISAIPGAMVSSGGGKALVSGGYFIMAGSGSVYNRNELAVELRCSENETDINLMSLAFNKWDCDAPSHLDGDWMFSAYDYDNERLVLARSWGISSLYYHHCQSFTAFATHPAALTEIPGINRKIDVEYISSILCQSVINPEASCWKGISQVKPATVLEISRRRLREKNWWRPSNIERIEMEDQEDALEKFVTLYASAVKKRLRTQGNVGATLSAGLDSSSVCMLAARELDFHEKDVYAWTSVPCCPDEAYTIGRRLTDESRLAGVAAMHASNLRHTVADAADGDPIDSIRLQVLHTGRPSGPVPNTYWINYIMRLAKESGCTVMLTGQFGNGTVSWSPSMIPMFPKSRYFPGTGWGSYIAFIKRKAAAGLLRKRQDIYERCFRRQDRYPVINQEYMQTNDFKRYLCGIRDVDPMNQAEQIEMHMGTFDAWYQTSLWNGVEVRDPTMDKELTVNLLSLPVRMFFRDGMDRRVMRLGMKGILPDEIRINRRRGQQASDIVPRVRRRFKGVEYCISCMESSNLAREMLNIQRMKQISQRIKAGESSPEIMKECVKVLISGLSAGIFLASLDTGLDLTKPIG